MDDVLGFRDQYATNLMAMDDHGENGIRRSDSFIACMGNLDAACLTAMADFHLRLDDARISDGIRSLGDFVGIRRINPTWGGNPLLVKQLASLILV